MATATKLSTSEAVSGVVYVVTNILTGAFYIGQTRRDVMKRWAAHCSDASRGSPTYFHAAIRRYGPAAFETDVLATASTVERLNQLESQWILITGAMKYGYNLSSGGDRSVPSDETRLKMSATRKGRRQTIAHRLARSAALKGKSPSESTLQAVRIANAARIHSPETRQKLSAASRKGNAIRWSTASRD